MVLFPFDEVATLHIAMLCSWAHGQNGYFINAFLAVEMKKGMICEKSNQ